ncbi:unnamed protein product (macronuclear) [Paramecium tetraurelia]|uniref:Uncharacterized protein n=1 Tax=Paramecium tetraurelia TaxID=5888 RepID=A0E6K5_PARTE|nr:uncharacterized protein GSPATT00003787001 [Paramecium tetraurelia]CAK90922.1 unnamed protein product [Paramecium tetraurelia]|eukprot:XP_001458319.1 hypothetical protein (macronuclear) [Paramecium tetraurelia strain d4-2]
MSDQPICLCNSSDKEYPDSRFSEYQQMFANKQLTAALEQNQNSQPKI